MNFVDYINDNNLVGTVMGTVSSTQVRILCTDYSYPGNEMSIVGYDIENGKLMTFKADGSNPMWPHSQLIKTRPRVWVLVLKTGNGTTESHFTKNDAYESAKWYHSHDYPVDIYEVVLSDDMKVKEQSPTTRTNHPDQRTTVLGPTSQTNQTNQTDHSDQ